jgi:hypothetical protein
MQRRAELQKEWEENVGALRGRTATATAKMM